MSGIGLHEQLMMKQSKREARRTAIILGCVALLIYVGFYFLVASK